MPVCGDALTHGVLTRSRLAPEHIRQQLAMGWSEPASMGALQDMATAMPDQVASGGLELQLDRLRANLPRVSTDGLDAVERMIGTMSDEDNRQEGLALVREERARRPPGSGRRGVRARRLGLSVATDRERTVPGAQRRGELKAV